MTVIGSVELLVRKLYYKFCNERKKYPVELKRRQPNKRKRLTRDDEPALSITPQGRNSNTINDLDRLMHLWTASNDYKDSNLHHQQQQQSNQQHSPSGSSSGSSSPVSNHINTDHQEQSEVSYQKYRPLNLSTANHHNISCDD